MKKVSYFILLFALSYSCKKTYTCECTGEKKVIETQTINGSVTTDTIVKTIFDSEIFREKDENEAFSKCSNKKNIILSELTNSETSVIIVCELK